MLGILSIMALFLLLLLMLGILSIMALSINAFGDQPQHLLSVIKNQLQVNEL
jgi:hypothetical protein